MQFPQIGSQQGIRLRFRHIGRQFLVGKNLVAVPHIRPVSYTHLDVYKRQIKNNTPWCNIMKKALIRECKINCVRL